MTLFKQMIHCNQNRKLCSYQNIICFVYSIYKMCKQLNKSVHLLKSFNFKSDLEKHPYKQIRDSKFLGRISVLSLIYAH